MLFSPTFFQPTNNPKQPNQTKPANRDILQIVFFPDLFFKTNNSNQQQQRAEEQPFCYFPQHFFNQPTTQSNQTKPSQAKPSQTKPNQPTETYSRLFFFLTFFSKQTTAINSNKEPRNNHFAIFLNICSTNQQPKATKPNQTKPSQAKPNQTKPANRDILQIVFFPDLFFKTNNSNQQQQRAEEQPFCHFPQHFFNQPTTQSNQTKPNQTKPNQTKPANRDVLQFFS